MKTSFVIRGLITPWTANCIASIRYYYPNSEIIFSTWDYVEIPNHIICDKIVKSQDPGNTHNNQSLTNRQIVAARAGLQQVKTEQVVCIRSDMVFYSDNLLKQNYFRRTSKKASHYLWEHYIVTSSYYTVNPFGPLKLPYHVADRYQFGKTNDVKEYWNVNLTNDNMPKLRTEQHLLCENIKKTPDKMIYGELQHDMDVNENNAKDTLHWIQNNFIIVDDHKIGINCEKYQWIPPTFPCLITSDVFEIIKAF